MNHMHQVGLIPAKKPREQEPIVLDPNIPVPIQFLRRLDSLEKQVRQLQNKNKALEESYKKLNDLVEAQNHLLTSGGSMLQRMPTPACTAQETREDVVSTPETPPTDKKVIATASIPSYVTSNSDTITMTDYTRLPSTPPLTNKQNGVTAFELPRRVSAREVLHLWEYGCDDFPPLKDWTPTQKLRQQSKISRWKKLVDIFQSGYSGDWSKFEKSFSDSKGDVLPVTTILSLFETQQTPAFLQTSQLNKENGSHSPVRYKSDDDERSSSRQYIDDDSNLSDYSLDHYKRGLSMAAREQTLRENTTIKPDSSMEVRYTLPRKVTPKDIVHLWENGCEEFPPVGKWSRAQRIGQETKIFRWKKIVDIFNSDCNRNWDYFERKYYNEKCQPLPISSIIAKYDTENAVQGPIFDPIEPRRSSTVISNFMPNPSFEGAGNETVIVKAEHTIEPVEVKIEIPNLGDAENVLSLATTGDSTFSPQDSKTGMFHRREDKFILPRKVTAKDVIQMWEEGYGDVPPLSSWSPAQKSCQRSKFSRWAKIYDIYKYHYHGKMDDFERAFTDEKGELLPITTIVAIHDARESGSTAMCFSPGSVVQETPGGMKMELFQLPRKVTAKDVVQLWEEGCDRFPPVCTWPKIHRVGHETKLFRWKKIVDIFRKDCHGSWERFEQRFTNHKGELLPISAILAKYDLESEPVSYFKPLPLNTNGSMQQSPLQPALQPAQSHFLPLSLDKPGPTMADMQDLNTNHHSESADDDSVDSRVTSPSGPAPEFILPNRVSALDVIYFWENGLGDMPPVCQWSSQQKLSQKSKISRWNKIVDIFKYECGSDIRQFEEKYKDERGELMPITTIINLHNSQDKPWEID